MKKIVSLFFFSLISTSMMADQAWPVRKTMQTVDGQTVTVNLKGDEHYSFYQTDDGKRFSSLQSGLLKPLSEFEILNATEQAAKSRYQNNQRRAARRSARRSSATIGKHTGLVILANFTDVKFTTGNNAAFVDLFNKPGYNDNGNAGSVHDYFYDQSYGKFDVGFDIVGPIQLPHEMAYYGEPVYDEDGKRIANDQKPMEFAVDAIKAAAATQSVDFNKYDWDDDGIVDQVFIIYAGYGEATGGPANSIWAHEWDISAYNLSYNGKFFATYGCAPELRYGNELAGVGTPCHEFSHCLGLMDTYDTGDSGNFAMGNWDVMSSGNHLEDGHCPMAYNAFERWVSGWVEPVNIDKEMTITDMKRLEDSPEAYILCNEGNTNEFYTLENRYNPKWGKAIKAHGLVITHIDYDPEVWYYNQINTVTGHERCTIIPADNMRETNYAGDPYPGERKNTALTDTSVPAATLFNKNVDGLYLMGKPIEEITETSDGLISFYAMRDVVYGPKHLSVDSISNSSFKLTWDEVDNVENYEVEITEIDAPKTNPYEALMFEEDFATSCYKEKVSDLNNDAGKLDNYTVTKGWTGTNLFRGPQGLQIGTKAKKGTLKTMDIDSPFYGYATQRLIVSPAVSGETVKTKVNFYVDGSYYGSWSFNVSTKDTLILNGIETHGKTAYEIAPESRLNIAHYALYDGDFNIEDFDFKNNSKSKAKRINLTMESSDVEESSDDKTCITSKTNSIIYDKVVENNTYICRVRAKLTNGNYTKWSAETSYRSASATSIDAVSATKHAVTDNYIYNLSGQKVSRGYKGIIISNGRKILVK